MVAMAFQITCLTIVYSTFIQAQSKKKQCFASLAFVTGEFPAQMASNTEMCPFDDVIMSKHGIEHHLLPVNLYILTITRQHVNSLEKNNKC